MAEMLPERVTSYHFEEKLMDRLQSYNRYPNFVQPSGPDVFVFSHWLDDVIYVQADILLNRIGYTN